MPEQTLPAVVPDLRMAVRGWAFGGQYETEAEFEVLARPLAGGGVCIELVDTLGAVRFTQDLTAALACTVHEALLTPTVDPAPDVPGLQVEVTWTFGDDSSWADLRPHLRELSEWLSYATGRRAWDWDETDTWEF